MLLRNRCAKALSQEPSMQTHKRTQLHTPPVTKRTPTAADKRAPKVSAPVELDSRALKHVAGGVEGPNKFW
jgi:hypothetical protein